MGSKRGRPLKDDGDERGRQQRARNAERQRRARALRAEARAEQILAASNIQPTPDQLQQGESIINLPFERVEIDPTIPALALRIQGITLAQDPVDAQAQRHAVAVEEHERLYHNFAPRRSSHPPPPYQPNSHITPTNSSISSIHTSSSRPSQFGQDEHPQTNLSQFFRTLPARNPFNPAQHVEHAHPGTSRSPTDDQSIHPHQDENNIENNWDDSEEFHDPADGRKPSSDREQSPRPEIHHQSPHSLSHSQRSSPTLDHNRDPVQHEGSRAGQIHHQLDSDSHHLTDSDSDSDRHIRSSSEEDEISALDYTLDKLYQQFLLGHNGCTDEQHQERLQRHMDSTEDDHHGLDAIFNDVSFPSVLASPEIITPARLARQENPTPTQWQSMFCGLSSPPRSNQRPMQVCLHESQAPPVESEVGYDIDSFLGFFRTLAAARSGIFYQPVPLIKQNISTDVHIRTERFEEHRNDGAYHLDDDTVPDPVTRSKPTMLQHVPHFFLGRLIGAPEITLHILFPHLPIVGEKFISLTRNQLEAWTDRIFLPAIHKHAVAHYTQHLPASLRVAINDSKAHQTEGRSIETSLRETQQAICYILQPAYLGPIWDEVLTIIAETPGLQHFREPQLYFSAKGTKLQFKTNPSQPTILDAMQFFEAYLRQHIDLDLIFLDRLYIDIGKEICSHFGLVPAQIDDDDDQAQVYLWKRCCLEHYLHMMYDGKPPAIHGPGQRYYYQNMLYDAVNLTSVSPQRSRLREGGIIYSQFYGSVKELSDAAKRYPFDHDGLEELALDPEIARVARVIAKGRRADVGIIERAYRASKRRVRDVLIDARGKSFGLREEHRITWALFHALLERVQNEDSEEWETMLPGAPSYAWAVDTRIYLNFLWRSADKFATGFEVVRARTNRQLVTWEQTKVMAMFLRCLRFVFGGHQLSREPALWWSRQEAHNRRWYGLGFRNTLPRYKYCWLEPRLDWTRLVFLEDVTDHVLFGNNSLRGHYLKHSSQIRHFFDATRRLELALSWLAKYPDQPRLQRLLIDRMIHLCLHQFRIDTLENVRKEIAEEHREEALLGLRSFTYEYLDEIMEGGVHIISGNKTKRKSVKANVHLLFHYDDGLERSHWEHRAFRKLYRRACTALESNHGGPEGLASTFRRRFSRMVPAYHWILPYAHKDGLVQTVKPHSKRMWFSIRPPTGERRDLPQVSLDEWAWAEDAWLSGPGLAIPAFVSQEKEEWEEPLHRIVRNMAND